MQEIPRISELKIYYQDSTTRDSRVDSLKRSIKIAAGNIDAIADVELSRAYGLRSLPADYDFYFIHLRDLTDAGVLQKLNEESPWSYKVLISGYHISQFPSDVRDNLDGRVDIWTIEQMEKILTKGIEKIVGKRQHTG